MNPADWNLWYLLPPCAAVFTACMVGIWLLTKQIDRLRDERMDLWRQDHAEQTQAFIEEAKETRRTAAEDQAVAITMGGDLTVTLACGCTVDRWNHGLEAQPTDGCYGLCDAQGSVAVAGIEASA